MTDLTPLNVPALSNRPNVEIAQTGQWDISTGRVTLTRADFANAVAALDCPAVRRPVLKLGHMEPMPADGMRWDGEPAIGYVDNMALADNGDTIVGDYMGMPGWLGPILPSAYPDRSMEATYDFQCQIGHVHPFVITAVALLGVTPPGIGTLGSLQDVANLYGVAASSNEMSSGFAVVIKATAKELDMPNPRPKELAAGVTTEDVRRQYYDSGAANMTTWIKEMQLDPPELITVDEATGQYARVPITISDGGIQFGDPVPVEITYVDKPQETTPVAASRLVYASATESRPNPVKEPARKVETELAPVDAIKRVHQASANSGGNHQEGTGDMDPVKIREALGLAPEASDSDVFAAIAASRQPAPVPATEAPAPMSVAAAGSGVMTVDKSVILAMQEQIELGKRAYAQMQRDNRDRTISAAVEQGKFAPARREEFERLWDVDPDGTEALIKSLAPGLVPLQASGYSSAVEVAEADEAYYRMYPETRPAN